MANSIFISLTEQDSPIAEALSKALKELVGEALDVPFSTSKRAGVGPAHGEDWFKWIVDRVHECDFALILLTPASIQKPWILWEAGAVHGAASVAQGGRGKVRPLVFRVRDEQLPSPIREAHSQFRRGDHPADVDLLFTEIVEQYSKDWGMGRIRAALDKLKTVVPDYVSQVNAALLRAPGVPTAVALEEWLSRLDALLKQNRQSEVVSLQDWMEIAFGRASTQDAQPLDLRIHTRLGDVYLTTRSYQRAVKQFELAQIIAPRDIYVLRSLGRAYLETKNPESALTVIKRIEELDADAFERNAECAALRSRYFRETGNLKDAIAVLGKALANPANADSYYLANLQGELSLQAGDAAQTRTSFQLALDIIARLREANIWTHATAANAAFVVGDDPLAATHLKAVVATNPDPGELATVERGLRRLAPLVDRGDERMVMLINTLRPPANAPIEAAQPAAAPLIARA